MTEDQKTRLFDDVYYEFPLLRYMQDTGAAGTLKEALLYAHRRGLADAIQRSLLDRESFLETILWRAGWNPLPDETLEDMVYRNRGSRIGALETIARELGIDALFFNPPSPKKDTT